MADTTSFIPKQMRPHVWVRQDGCWSWTGALDSSGYGQLKWRGKNRRAHRVAWELSGRELDNGLVIDHVCRNRACVNPEHMQQVSAVENTFANGSVAPAALNAAKTHCVRGHAFDDENTYHYRSARLCRACRRIQRTGVATQVVAPIVASQPDATPNMVYCSVCVTDYPLPLGVDLVAWKAEHRASCG